MDLVVVLVVVALTVAALGAYVYLSTRTTRAAVAEPVRPLATPRVARPRVNPLADATPLMRTVSEPVVRPAAPTARVPVPPVTPAPLFDIDHEPPVVAVPAEIRWSKRFDPRSGTLDETARLRLIGDLGVVAKEWCVPLLAQAYDEERRSGHRQAALIALAACRSRAASATFRTALTSDDAGERAIAADALADLEPASQVKTRRIVERH